VTITLNGERHEIPEPMTVDALLASLAIDPRRVAVAHNRTIVRRPRYGEIVVDQGDTVEIVNFVGGG
jgi:thiamine biosynthesis protein ThiS